MRVVQRPRLHTLSAPARRLLDPDFLLSLRIGAEVAVQEEGAGGGGEAAWHPAIVVALHTDGELLYGSAGATAPDAIGRGGFPSLPALIAVEVICCAGPSLGTVVSVPVVSGRIAHLQSHPLAEPPHAFAAGMFVDVVRLEEASASAAAAAAAERRGAGGGGGGLTHPPRARSFFHELSLPGNRVVVAEWRWAEVVRVGASVVRVRYVADEGVLPAAAAPPEEEEEEEDIDIRTEAWRIRAHGSMTDVVSEDERRRVEESAAFISSLAAAGLVVVPTPADGNCLFGAVAHQVFGAVALHGLVRAEVVAHMRANPGLYEPIVRALLGPDADTGADAASPFSAYLAAVAQSGEWGGYAELLAAEELYDRPVQIYDSEDFLLRCGGRRAAPPPLPAPVPHSIHFRGEVPEEVLASVEPIRLSYHGHNHYASLVLSAAGRGEAVPAPPRGTTQIRDARAARMADEGLGEAGRLRASAETAARDAVDEVVRRHVRRSTEAGLAELAAAAARKG
jgi:hypothetical protein